MQLFQHPRLVGQHPLQVVQEFDRQYSLAEIGDEPGPEAGHAGRQRRTLLFGTLQTKLPAGTIAA
ncbi:MAG: hypothetical protein ACKN89_02965, partial [Cyanobium sp.]